MVRLLFCASTHISAMTSPKKCNVRPQKFRTKHKFKGRRRKAPRTTATNENAPTCARPDGGIDECASDSGCDEGIDAALSFVSASEKKLGFFEKDERQRDEVCATTVLCDTLLLTALVAGAACPACGIQKLAVREPAEKRKGLSSLLELHCENSECSATVLSCSYTSLRVTADGSSRVSQRYDSGSSRDSFAVNVKAVVAARAVGIGHEQLSRFCSIIGLPKPMHHRGFFSIAKKVHTAAMAAVSENLRRSRELTKEVAGETDVAVMFDGTWQKRGHKSHNGIGAVISLDTGLCLDFEVISNYCLTCSRHKDMGPDEEVWQAFHGPVCEKNADCSSHAMETEAAMRIWQRTLTYDTPLHFMTFLSDGDSKAYSAVAESKVYGAVNIEKEDCTNHVAKRLGTALRKLHVPLPRGQKMKEPAIQKLQTYYQIAITSNRGSVRDMYTAVWASYFHSCSTDNAGSHKFCPAGTESWCKHQRAEALGEPAPRHTPLLTKAQGLAVLPIYKRLTDEKLLARCIKGKTQNASESLNSKIWLLCPKTKFVSRTVVETAAAMAILWFNKGHATFEHILEELNILPSRDLVTFSDSRDARRIKRMSERLTAEARAHRRRGVKRARLEESARKDREGTTYAAGQF